MDGLFCMVGVNCTKEAPSGTTHVFALTGDVFSSELFGVVGRRLRKSSVSLPVDFFLFAFVFLAELSEEEAEVAGVEGVACFFCSLEEEGCSDFFKHDFKGFSTAAPIENRLLMGVFFDCSLSGFFKGICTAECCTAGGLSSNRCSTFPRSVEENRPKKLRLLEGEESLAGPLFSLLLLDVRWNMVKVLLTRTRPKSVVCFQ
jgi:hypothetical protein